MSSVLDWSSRLRLEREPEIDPFRVEIEWGVKISDDDVERTGEMMMAVNRTVNTDKMANL